MTVKNIDGTWDYITVGDYWVPGICSISTSIVLKTKTGEAKGIDSPSLTPGGLDLIKLNVTSTNIDNDAPSQWETFLTDINAITPGKERTPFEVYTNMCDIVKRKKFYVTNVTLPGPKTSEPWIVTMELIEATEPKPAKSSKTTKAQQKKQTLTAPSGLSNAPRYTPRS